MRAQRLVSQARQQSQRRTFAVDQGSSLACFAAQSPRWALFSTSDTLLATSILQVRVARVGVGTFPMGLDSERHNEGTRDPQHSLS